MALSNEEILAGLAELVNEETGIAADDDFTLYDVQNGFDDTLVIFGLATPKPREILHPFSSPETQEVLLIARPMELGFPMHTAVVRRYFAERGVVPV